MGRTGARWSAAGTEAIMRLRALRASVISTTTGRFIWRRSTSAHINPRYADKVVPNPLRPRRAKLRLVT
jgi:hypothetical protein